MIPVLSADPSTSNIIEYILSLNVEFKPSESVSLLKKIKALGGKYTRLKDWILESETIEWDDKYLNLVPVETLFGDTAEQVVAAIIKKSDHRRLTSAHRSTTSGPLCLNRVIR